MAGSHLLAEFLVHDSSIDCNCITVPARDASPSDGWLLSSPVTTAFSKMHLNRPRQVSLSPDSDGYLSSSTLDRLTKACQATSKELQNRLSIASDSSDPGMMYDPFNSSDSETSFEDSLTRIPSEADLAALQIENETWDLYWTPVKESPLPLRVEAYRSPTRQDPNLSPCNHNFASSNLSSLNSPESNRDLQRRSEVRRAPRRLNHSSPPSLPLLSRTTYSPFPNCTSDTPSTPASYHSIPNPDPQASIHPTDPQHTQHKSWPTRTTSTLPPRPSHPPLRTRAYTTPSTPSKFTPTFPSNLSTCTTLDYQPSRTSSPCMNSSLLYIRSPPSPGSDDFGRRDKRERELGMDMGNETSVWEEDDENDGMGGLVGSLRSKLHIRSSSTQEEGELGVKVRQEKKRTRRSLSEIVKGAFRVRKKGGTL